MNLKKSNGITLVVLIITIIVMLIIAGITIYGGSNLIKEAEVEDVKTNMLLVQAEVKNFVEQAKFENKTIDSFTGDGVKVDDKTLKLEEVRVIDGENFYKITTPLSDLKLKDMDENLYLISIDIENIKVEVYFEPGISDSDGTVYHYLSDMKM